MRAYGQTEYDMTKMFMGNTRSDRFSIFISQYMKKACVEVTNFCALFCRMKKKENEFILKKITPAATNVKTARLNLFSNEIYKVFVIFFFREPHDASAYVGPERRSRIIYHANFRNFFPQVKLRAVDSYNFKTAALINNKMDINNNKSTPRRKNYV